MKFLKIPVALTALGVLLATTGCKDFFNINVDPINPTLARNQDLLPVAQANMALNLGWGAGNLSQLTGTLTAQLASGRIGAYSLDGNTAGNPWAGLYTDCLINNEQIITQATAAGQPGYLGIAQLQKAFVFSHMVDLWGNIPYSEALQGIAIRNPKFDRDADIYRSLFQLIDEGIANCGRASGSSVLGDIVYGSNFDKWQRMGRTLKLKLYNQIRLNPSAVGLSAADVTREVNSLLGQGLLSEPTQDFEVAFASTLTPENRNPGFQVNYGSTAREDFVGRYLFNLMRINKDPRIPYYYYNQKTGVSSEPLADYQDGLSPLFVVVNPDQRFVTRLLGSNGPNNATSVDGIITLPGLFPVGGKYDDGTGGQVVPANSATDANSAHGAMPQRLLTATSRYFTEAELRLTVLNDVAGAGGALGNALNASFAKVNQVAANNGVPAVSSRTRNGVVVYVTPADYVAAALARYANPPAGKTQLEVIMEEKYVAGFGFGPDVYTDYRRTGFPKITIPGQEPGTINTGGPGFYPRLLTYRQGDLTSNSNAPAQHNVATDRVFWDVR